MRLYAALVFIIMRKFKNLIFIVLALLPLLPVLAGVVSAIGEGSFTLLNGDFDIVDHANGTVSIIGSGSLYENTCGIFLKSDAEYTGLIKALAHFSAFLETNAGVPSNTITFFAYLYFVYSFVIFLLSFIFDLLTFVPKKCSEVFAL